MIGDWGTRTKKVLPYRKTRKVGVCSDFHIPFVCEKTLEEIINSDINDIVVLGDIFDMYAASRHRNSIEYITVRDELAQGRALLETLCDRFDSVTLLKSGNHDVRGLRRLQDLAPQLLPLIVHPIDIISSGLSNVTILETEIPNTAPNVSHGKNMSAEFMGFVNDRLYGHFENFSGAEAAVQVDNWLNNWTHILKLENPVGYIFQSHCHRLGQVFTPRGRVLMSTGCVCRPMPYQIEGHGKYPPPTNGYITFEVDEKGNTINNSIRLIHVSGD